MSFRSRVAGLVALAVALAFLVASLAMFGATRRSLLAAVDDELREAAGPVGERADGQLAGLRQLLEDRTNGRIRRPDGPRAAPGPAGDALRGVGTLQILNQDGDVVASFPDDLDQLPLADGSFEQAMDAGTSSISTVRTDDGSSYRAVVARVGAGAIQVARPIDDIEEGLRRLALQLALVSVLGIGLAFVAGRVVADRVLRPVAKLTATAELIATTQQLEHRATVEGDDELARLGTALNGMLTALDTSRRAQHQLVADASHELRTPLTSLRTNVELLASNSDALTSDDRQAMRADVIDQIDEMTLLIGNLVDLARDGVEPSAMNPIELDVLVADVVERARRLSPEVTIDIVGATATTVRGDRERLHRAIANLVDNAVKYAGPAGPIDVEVATGTVSVRDRGAGVAPGDQPHVFDRFWRSPAARGAPGSGLGLAIVEQVAQAHGGTIEVADAVGGGAIFTLRLPEAPNEA